MSESLFDRIQRGKNIHTPDVLSCLANLSNDEVFTSPEIVNEILDSLPQELFEDPNAKFLDPACKTGVFLREIAKRLLIGIEPYYPDLQERIDHIFHEQLYGIAITELTSMLSRRSLYCSKYPNGPYSITKFNNPEGNIRFKRVKHDWVNGKCSICGASQEKYDRGDSMETHAYEFIHLTSLEMLENMNFDVIISNPPYHLKPTKDAKYSKAIYHLFVEQAIKLNPKYITMIIPSRWFSGGLGLDKFRDEMLSDDRISEIHDFYDASECFPGVEIKGGVSYFLWDKSHHGDCDIYSHKNNEIISKSRRPLLEKNMKTFIRDNNLVSIIKKVNTPEDCNFSSLISSYDPYGFDVREADGYKRVRIPMEKEPGEDRYPVYYNGWRNEGIKYVGKGYISKGLETINKTKVLIPKAWGVGDITSDWLNPFIAEEGSCCTETYLVVGPFKSKEEANNCISYMQTRFFHALVSVIKITQNTMQGAYSKVPLQDFSKPWCDEELYEKYNFTEEEIDYIENNVHNTGK